jgi:hypothetical protein
MKLPSAPGVIGGWAAIDSAGTLRRQPQYRPRQSIAAIMSKQILPAPK